MKELTVTGPTVDEAVQDALTQLNVTRDKVDIRVIDEGKKGLLGLFGSKPAVVFVKLNYDSVDEARDYLQKVLTEMEIHPEIKVERNGKEVIFKITGEDTSAIIGRRGYTLNALQYLVQLVGNKNTKQFHTFILDVENYREKRKETLTTLANRLADKAVATRRKVELEPMPAYERKVIHTVLSERRDIRTESMGDEPHRYLTIFPK
ncbi:MAG: protein jag [Bacillales bacterium]|nr:protein jag [Bacillales bacterium]